ncbi:MAG: glycosyltransferase [Arenicellales bacterium]
MIRVLFLVPSLTGGGAERVMVTLLRHLDRSRFEPILAVVDTRRAAFLDQVPKDVELIDLECSRVRRALPAIVRLIRRLRPEVVFSTLGHLNLGLAISRPLLPKGVKLIGRETTLVTLGLEDRRHAALWRLGYRRLYRRLDRVVCQSRAMRDDLVENLAFPPDKVAVIHNPVDMERIGSHLGRDGPARADRSDGTTLHLVAAGRLRTVKGFDLLLEAMALCPDLPMHLTLLGEGPEEQALRRLAASLGLQGRAEFAGFVPDPFALFARADAFVLSSRFEGFPNVVLEALACGTPVIATPARGGLREIIDTIPQCELANEVSAEALAGAIRSWAARRPGRVDAAVLAPFRVERIVSLYETEILRTAAGPPPAS